MKCNMENRENGNKDDMKQQNICVYVDDSLYVWGCK